MLVEGVRMADVSKVRQSQHSRKGGGTTTSSHEKCPIGARLYSQVHVCNHARCSANDPDYNVKSAVPLKKFLVAKKHAYGGLEEKGEKKRTSSVSSTISPDHPRDRRSHALQSLTNSVLTTESGSKGKVRSSGLRSNAQSVGQSRRATRDNSSISAETKKVVERKVRPTTTHSSSVPSGSSTRRSSVTATGSHSTAQKSRLSSAGSIFSPQATEQSKQWEDLASPESSITSISITQIISTRREEKKEEGEDETQELVKAAAAAAASSPTASVGSNQDTEISSLKETVRDFEQPAVNFGDLQSPASSPSNILQQNSGNREATVDSPPPSSPSVDNRSPVLESLSPSTPSTSVASATTETSSLTTTPASELSSSTLPNVAVGHEEINYGSSSPSVDSGPTTSGSLNSSVTSLTSGPRLSPGSTRRSSLTTTSPSSSDKLGRNFITSLKESPKVSPVSSSSRSSASRPSRIPRNSVSPAPVDSSPAPTNASRLAKNFFTDSQARSVPRRSTKGVRSIELRGGKAQSYSTSTVTSWNMTTTTVETSVSISEITTEKNVESGLERSGLVEDSVQPEQLSKMESQTAVAGPNLSAADPKAIKEPSTTVKFAKNARSFEEVYADAETVALKHGEVAERRLSEEYMTNHALEGVVSKISENDHRVKVLVHAFETLATLTDSEALVIEETTLNHDLAHESLAATTIAV